MKKDTGPGKTKTGAERQTLRTGVPCRKNGVWAPSCGCKSTLLQSGDAFPPCAQCGKSVDYEFVSAASK